jgi:hypothetical protein
MKAIPYVTLHPMKARGAQQQQPLDVGAKAAHFRSVAARKRPPAAFGGQPKLGPDLAISNGLTEQSECPSSQ